MTFEDIYEEFNFRQPLSQEGEEGVLLRYGSLENWRDIILDYRLRKNDVQLKKIAIERATYRVKMLNLAGALWCEFYCEDDQTLLDAADERGCDLSRSCMAGACSTCLGVIVEGTVNQDDQTYLDPEQVALGSVLLCVAYPTSDVTIQGDVEHLLY